MPGIFRYFMPRRKMWTVPRHITSTYNRALITTEQQIMLMAGYARDPDEAQKIYEKLRQEHGDEIWAHVHFDVRRPRTTSFMDRLLVLMRRIFGEGDTERSQRREHPDRKYRVNLVEIQVSDRDDK